VLRENPSLPEGIVLVPEEEPIHELVQRLQGGDPQAAELFAHYVRGLTRLAERHHDYYEALAAGARGQVTENRVLQTGDLRWAFCCGQCSV
jgi:hypothetical protein